MCKFWRTPTDTRAATGESYEGETMRLNGQQAALMMRPQWQRGFPWWALWLIWPVIGLVKWLAPLVAGAAVGLLDLLRQPITLEISLLPVVLIVLGVALVLRRRR
jgi:polyferredoxin